MPKRKKHSWLYRLSEAFLTTAILMVCWPVIWFALASASNAFDLGVGATVLFGLSFLLAVVLTLALFDLVHRGWLMLAHPTQRDLENEK